jgi:hypothetical protein
MQLYTSDYLADTAHLTTEEHGAYLLLLMNYWQRGKPLDNTGDRLAHVARLSAERWSEVEPVLSEFFLIDGDTWTHSRIERDLETIRQKSSKLSANAKQRHSNGIAIAEQMQYQEEEEEDEKEDKDNKKIIDRFDDFWTAYPRKTAKGAARAAWTKAIKKDVASSIIESALAFSLDPNRDESFTPHASTWLNQERWLDGPLPLRAPKAGVREADTRPTQVPPKYEAPDTSGAVPMPDSLRGIFAKIVK